ncbi:hypothetical protein [Actinomadura sp. 3N508]|uniref:hypothetical protein n=1 Tax=Actinomadura sp. 3N508 TaxID=3375153 RepID=UPI0037B8E147
MQGSQLIQQPVEHIACVISRRNSSHSSAYFMHALVEPLYVSTDVWQETMAVRLGQATGNSYWPAFETLDAGAESMARLVGLIKSEALPYFLRYGDLEGYHRLCEEFHQGRDVINPNILWSQAATELMAEQHVEAMATLHQIRRVVDADDDPAPWMLQIAKDADACHTLIGSDAAAARRSLLETEQKMRTRFKLPLAP